MTGKNLKSLILVESASKARAIRKFVGRSYAVISTEGFLKDLPKSRIGVDENYQPDYITVRGQGQLLAELKRETLNARRIFLATNPDECGEFLARQYCEIFGINPKSYCRIVLSELTKANFKAAFEEARAIDDNLAAAFQTKQIIDKYVSHKVGEYLERKIWRGVKVGRFRGMLLKLISEPPEKTLVIKKTLTLATLQELALTKLKFSPARTRFIADQLYEGIAFDKDCAGLITYPHGGEIFLTGESREPETIREFLTEYQFKLYSMIHAHEKKSETIDLDGTLNDAALMAKFDALGIDWSEVYSGGMASLLKRKYIAAEDSDYKITAVGRRVLEAVEEFFGEIFTPEAYNEVAAQISEVVNNRAKKLPVIKNYCTKFDAAFKDAMNSLGADAKPQDEPVVESDEICEKCGRKMLIRHGRYGVFLACSGYPECKNAKPLMEHLEQKCPKCGERLAKRLLSHGRSFYCCEACDFSTWDEPQSMTCKECGSTMFMHKFKDRAAIFYCGNDNCSTRENHPINKILADVKRRAELRKQKREAAS